MKYNTEPRFYFSAYPLSVIGGTSVIEPTTKKEGPVITLKILPSLDHSLPKQKVPALPQPDSVMPSHQWDIGWFNNYE